MIGPELQGCYGTPLKLNSFEEALKHATILTNPATGQSYRVNAIGDNQQILCVEEDSGEHLALSTADMEGWTIYTLQKVEYPTSDHGLTAAQLDDKYNPDGGGEHPIYRRSYWQLEVQQGNTLRGYWDWLESEIRNAEIDGLVQRDRA